MKSTCLLFVLTITPLLFLNTTFAQTPALGSASNFALFTAVGAFNNLGPSTITGDIGTNVGAFSGFPPGIVIGQIHVADAVSAQAAADVALAYADLSGITCGGVLGTTLGGGQVLTPNVYCLGAASSLNGNLTLDAQGDPTAMFIFQIDGALATSTLSNVFLVNSANLCNVYWQINGAFALGDGSTFVGTVVANGAISLANGATLNGRALSTAGAISTINNVVTMNLCQVPSIICPDAVTVSCDNLVPAANTGLAIVTVTCPGAFTVVHVGDEISNLTCTDRYTIVRTYQVTDACGITASCSQTITVNDLTPPVITCPTVPATIECPATPGFPDATASDLCGATPEITFNDVTSPGGICAQEYTITRTWTATDACGNTAECSRTISVTDNTPPSISCPVNVTVSCASNVPAPAPASITATDLCGGGVTVVHVNEVISAQTCPNRYTITRTYRATDICGNSTVCAQIITVNDQTPPAIPCPPTLTESCASNVPAPAPASITATDLCGGGVTVVHVNDVISAQTCPNRYTITRTYRATDICGNSTDCVQIINVFDNTAPIFTAIPPNTTVECTAVPAPADVTATDNCGGLVTVNLSQTQTPGICPILYTQTSTWTAVDLCGNSTVAIQTLTVIDTQDPIFTNLPGNVSSYQCGPANEAEYQEWLDAQGGATAIDCGLISWSYINTPGNFPTTDCGNTFGRYIRFIATDECGNSAFRDASFIVTDTTPPTFSVYPQDLEVECLADDNGEIEFYNWLENLAGLQVADDCGEVTLEWGLQSENKGCGNTWSKTYYFRATDECENSITKLATFRVVDLTPPTIQCPSGNDNLDCEFDLPAPDISTVIASDNCGLTNVVFDNKFVYGNACEAWPQTVIYTYTAYDECGNSASCYQSFQIVDTLPPIYSGPDTIDVFCVDDLPGAEELTTMLAPYFLDECYAVFCINSSIVGSGVDSLVAGATPAGCQSIPYNLMASDTSWIQFCVKAKDLCGNWTDRFQVVFIATGNCKPMCSNTADVWGDENSVINGEPVQAVLDSLFTKYGPLTVGRANRTVSVASPYCVFALLPGSMEIAEFGIGNFIADPLTECYLPNDLLNADGSIANRMAAQTMALQLNIWYNKAYNNRELGFQALNELPLCLIDKKVSAELGPNANVQNLLLLGNNFLSGVGYFSPSFGAALANSIENLNLYWKDCQENNPCKPISGGGQPKAFELSNPQLTPNPVQDMVTLTFEATDDSEMQVRFIGNLVVRSETTVEVLKGFNTLNFSTQNFPAGVYTVVLQHANSLHGMRMIKIAD